MSLDGRIAGRDGAPMLFSDEADRQRVHEMRAAHDAILVGVGTVLSDDPGLRVDRKRVAVAQDPLRVVLDSSLRTPAQARVCTGADTRVYHREGLQARDQEGVVFVPVPAAEDAGLDLLAVLRDLARIGVRSLMVEGGSRVIGSFLAAGLVDEVFVFVAPVVVGPPAPPFAATHTGREVPFGRFTVVASEHRSTGVLMRLVPDA